MVHELIELPYALDALEPHISKETLEFHYGKHHRAYVNNLNNLIKDTEFEEASLEDIVKKSEGGIFNNAGQILNHNIYWTGFKSNGGGLPGGRLAEAIERSFESVEKMIEIFNAKSMALFGSGWSWLVADNGKLEVVTTPNGGNPIRENKVPIIGCDLWEHAYYIDRRNVRADYLKAFWQIIDWGAAEKNYSVSG